MKYVVLSEKREEAVEKFSAYTPAQVVRNFIKPFVYRYFEDTYKDDLFEKYWTVYKVGEHSTSFGDFNNHEEAVEAEVNNIMETIVCREYDL